MTPLITPALRCKMGDWIYYVSFMGFRDITRIKPTDEVHKSKKLSEWIQRQLIQNHAGRISDYLIEQPERFFSSIVVGVYEGEPEWSPLDISMPPPSQLLSLTPDQLERLESSVGILHLTGDEKLFAIDGQHRVEGIKRALEREPDRFTDDELSVVFVGHDTTSTGRQRTRRLFTTLNKTARRVSSADRLALDEDDGFAIVTRRLVDDFPLFRGGEKIAFNKTASLRRDNTTEFTTIISLYGQMIALYSSCLAGGSTKRGDFKNSRPSDQELERYFASCCDYWIHLCREVEVVEGILSGTIQAGSLRQEDHNHLLARPIGQRVFAEAVGLLLGRGKSLRESVKRLSSAEMWLDDEVWHFILWDPIKRVMERSSSLGVTMLLKMVGEEARSIRAADKLEHRLAERSARLSSEGSSN